MESAQAKNQALREAGAVVPTSYEAFEGAIKDTFDKLVCLQKVTLHFLLTHHPFSFISCLTESIIIVTG